MSWNLAGVTEVEDRWLPEVAKPLIRISGPLEDPPPHCFAAAGAVVIAHYANVSRQERPIEYTLKEIRRCVCTGVTEIEARWLPEVAKPLVRLSGPLEAPPPHYSAAADAVVTTHDASFGQHEWPMPAQEQPCTDAALQARHFAAALLDGFVLPSMKGRRASCLLYAVSMPAHAEM